MPAIDFSDVPEITPIPAGEYEAEVTSAQAGFSGSGNPKIDVRYTVVLPESGEQRVIFDTISFHPKALWRAKQTLQSLGFPKDFSGEVDPDALIGQMATIVVAIDSGRSDPTTGEPYPDRNRVVKVKPVSAARPAWTAPEEDELDESAV
jgi:hypothetical protein